MKPDIKGLIKLGNYLKRLPRRVFEQGHWMEERVGKKQSQCGTSACVAGHAAMAFPSRFKRVGNNEWTTEEGVIIRGYEIMHRASGDMGTDAFATAFRLTIDDAMDITDSDASHRTPKQAARAIFKLVDRLKKNATKA